MTEQNHTNTGQAGFTQAGRKTPDLSASLVTGQDGQKSWQAYFNVYRVIEGYFKGTDADGHTIIVQTRAAKEAELNSNEQQSAEQQSAEVPKDTDANKRRPDLFIYREVEEEEGTVWHEIHVAWHGKKDGYFISQNDNGDNIVIQTKAAKEANFKQRTKRVAPVDLSAAAQAEPDIQP